MPKQADWRERSEDGYKSWLERFTKTPLTSQKRLFDIRVTEMQEATETSPFWVSLLASLREWDTQYQLDRGARLLAGYVPTLEKKTFESALNKAFRRDCLNNPLWPDSEDGATRAVPSTYHSTFNDLVRTTIYVRYLDGAPFLAERICELCVSHGSSASNQPRADVNGYYAVHVEFPQTAEVTTRDFARETIQFNVEIQIATMTQRIVRELSHNFYESRRVSPQPEEGWQWKPGTEAFETGYLGHLLHYADGMLVATRDRYVRRRGQ
ncbi:MAG: hypothetical protein FJ037_03915 [Chloroflexi bacterium]|nr:hypothetical protein [Chloroflexota bacterium]